MRGKISLEEIIRSSIKITFKIVVQQIGLTNPATTFGILHPSIYYVLTRSGTFKGHNAGALRIKSDSDT